MCVDNCTVSTSVCWHASCACAFTAVAACASNNAHLDRYSKTHMESMQTCVLIRLLAICGGSAGMVKVTR
eukprot:5534838-Pleurochrysis_carterae.AAC.1